MIDTFVVTDNLIIFLIVGAALTYWLLVWIGDRQKKKHFQDMSEYFNYLGDDIAGKDATEIRKGFEEWRLSR